MQLFRKLRWSFVIIVLTPFGLGIAGLIYGASGDHKLLLATSSVLVIWGVVSIGMRLLPIRKFRRTVVSFVAYELLPLALGITGLVGGAERGSALLLATGSVLVMQAIGRFLWFFGIPRERRKSRSIPENVMSTARQLNEEFWKRSIRL